MDDGPQVGYLQLEQGPPTGMKPVTFRHEFCTFLVFLIGNAAPSISHYCFNEFFSTVLGTNYTVCAYIVVLRDVSLHVHTSY